MRLSYTNQLCYVFYFILFSSSPFFSAGELDCTFALNTMGASATDNIAAVDIYTRSKEPNPGTEFWSGRDMRGPHAT